MNNDIKCLVYKKLLNQKTVFYEITPVSVLNDYLNNDARIVSDVISLYINILSRSIINIITVLWLLYNISYKLCLIVLILVPIDMLVLYVYEKIYKYLMNDFDEINKKLNNYVNETISHISILKTYAIEDKCSNKHNKLNNDISKFYIKESFLYAINAFINFSMPVVSMILIIIFAKYFKITNGLVTFILHYKSLLNTIKELIDIKCQMLNALKPYNRVMDIIYKDNENEFKGHYIPNNSVLVPKIELNNVCFKYQSGSNNILNNFNFTIEANDKIAIIGKSGSGKSTVAKLLVGILTIDSGNIFINNINMNIYDNKWLKNKIGYVAQDSILFSDTIANNIAYGVNEMCTNEMDMNMDMEIKKAAILANADEFIDKMENKYNTMINGSELSSLSGGQKQRISIARALMKNPQIIIFDEATSALDPYCEEIVHNTIKKYIKYLNELNKQITMIVIAHRKSALELVDKVYKFENGEINRYFNEK